MSLKLKLSISSSEKEFREKFGKEVWETIMSSTIKQCGNNCQGCGYNPISKDSEKLELHLTSVNEKIPEKSRATILCQTCHITQHIDKAIEMGWVKLVNSKFSQTEIISMSRVNDIIRNINNGEVRILRKEPLDYLKKRLEGVLPKNDKMKVIFTQEFIEKITEK